MHVAVEGECDRAIGLASYNLARATLHGSRSATSIAMSAHRG